MPGRVWISGVLWLMLSSLPVMPARGAEPLVIGVLPYLAAGELHRRFDPLADYLSVRLGREVRIQVAASYAATVDEVATGATDVAFLGPGPYVRLVRQSGPKRLLARIAVNGSPYFHGYIVTRQDSPLRRLEELAGRSFAFGDPESTLSHLVPHAMLIRAGVPTSRLARFVFVSNHENVALGVLAGVFDAGAVMADVYEDYRARGLRVLAQTPELSGLSFVASDRLPEASFSALREALLTLRSPEILSGIERGATALVPATDADYEPMRTLMNLLDSESADEQP